MTTQQTTKAAFQVWMNGNTIQTSGLYMASESEERLNDFIESHFTSGTFATLHEFDSEEEAIKEYERINSEDYDN